MNKFETIVFAATKSAFMKNNMVSDNQTIINNNINNDIIKNNNNNINNNEDIIEVFSNNKKTNAGQNCGEARAPSNYKNLNESGKNKNNSDINNNNKEYNDKHGINNNNNNNKNNNNNNSNNDNIDNKKISDIDLLDNEDGDISTTAAAAEKTTISRTTQDDHVTSVESANDLELDLASTDEIKVYKDEGDDEEGGRSVENLSEEKLDLVIETEEGKSSDTEEGKTSAEENSEGPLFGSKLHKYSFFDRLPFGYPILSPYPHYPSSSPLVTNHGELLPPHLGLYMYNDQPPPAHMGIQPLQIHHKTGLPRTPLYPAGHLGHPLYPPDLSQIQSLDLISRSSPVSSLCGSYTTNLCTPSLAWLGASGMIPPPPPGFPYHNFNPHSLITSSTFKQEMSPRSENAGDDLRNPRLKQQHSNHQHHHQHHQQQSVSSSTGHSSHLHQRFLVHGGSVGHAVISQHQEKKRPYVKKPLNAYMLFMKEMRQSVIEECTLKESAAINQILGRKWHALDKSEQQKYYDMAKREKELHLQMYPGWSARDNYATHTKKKKRKKEAGVNSVVLMSSHHHDKRPISSGSNHNHNFNGISTNNHSSIDKTANSHHHIHRNSSHQRSLNQVADQSLSNPFENHLNIFTSSHFNGFMNGGQNHNILSQSHLTSDHNKFLHGVHNSDSCPHNLNCKSHFGLDQHHNWCSDCRLLYKNCELSNYSSNQPSSDNTDTDNETMITNEDQILCLSQNHIPKSIVSL